MIVVRFIRNYSLSILSRINSPFDLHNLSLPELEDLALEVREYMIEVVRNTGGHLAPSLGVVELTIALLNVFPGLENRIIWDVGHQAYAHKILTGRRDAFASLRQLGGLAGFPRSAESLYDAFDTGHSSTSISAALGMALAKKRLKKSGRVVAVIGDGALSSGLAFEGLNQAGDLSEDLMVVLNDNGMSIAPNVGALSRFMSRTTSGKTYQVFRRELGRLLKSLPAIGDDLLSMARRTEESIKALSTPGILFEAFKFNYVGPIDGHDISRLMETFHTLAQVPGPVLVHVLTQKGRGFLPAEENPSRFHGIGAKFDDIPADSAPPKPLTFTQAFGNSLLELARADKNIIAISAAMPDGTGLLPLAMELPDQFIDVGIAEQHALTMAAGLASQGLKPVVAIYSTFMQRGFDQIIHDICIAKLPVILALDRAGIVGEDGSTHQGLFDISFLRVVPNLAIMAPSDENELRQMLYTALQQKQPVALRYPRGSGPGVDLEPQFTGVEWGKSQLLKEGKDVLLLPVGHCLAAAWRAADMLAAQGIEVALINPRFIKPLDEKLICQWAQNCGKVVTIEENVAAGGFGSLILETLNKHGIQVPIKILAVNDVFVEHGPQAQVRHLLGLDADGIVTAVKELL